MFAARLTADKRIPSVLQSRQAIALLTIAIVFAQMLFAFKAQWTLMNTLFSLCHYLFYANHTARQTSPKR